MIPIVNENDVVATTELMFTDNDELAGLVTTQLQADTLVILTSTEGILDEAKKTVPEVDASNRGVVEKYITPDKTTAGRGGMTSKFSVAVSLSSRGTDVYIVNGRSPDVLPDVFSGKRVGTRFVAQA